MARRRWWPARRRGSVDAIMVRIHESGSNVNGRYIAAGRVAVTWEDHDGRVLVEGDLGSMAGMLAQALARVEALRVQRHDAVRRAQDRVLLAAARRELREGQGG